MDNDGCPSHGWSIVTSAQGNSQLAGLLAGFLFSGIVILFTLKGPKHTKALSLFCATFVVLGFDSYLFNLVSGDGSDRYCTRVWGEGMAASGMLGIGAAGLFSGICWLLSVHADTAVAPRKDRREALYVDYRPASPAPRLDLMGSLMVQGTHVIISLLLARTAADFLGVTYQQRGNWTDGLWQWVYAVPALVAGTALILAWRRARRPRAAARRRQLEDGNQRWISFTVFGMLIYGIAVPIFAGVLTNLPDTMWSREPPTLVGLTLAIELLFPGVLLVGLVLALPFLDRPSRETEADPMNEDEGQEPTANSPAAAIPAVTGLGLTSDLAGSKLGAAGRSE
jgi:hypothetical protein